jgi:uncharacterized membrane protein
MSDGGVFTRISGRSFGTAGMPAPRPHETTAAPLRAGSLRAGADGYAPVMPAPRKDRPRRPIHPYLVAVPLVGTLVALVAAVIGLTPAGGPAVWVVWWGALVVALVAAVPTAIAGALDLRALRRTTHAARAALTHGGIMVGGTLPLLFAAIIGAGRMDAGIRPVDAFVTALAAAILFGGAVLGAVAMHVWGAGAREETLTEAERGPQPARTPIAGLDR